MSDTDSRSDGPGALAGRRVLDLTSVRGAYCGKLMADLGADVLKVEPPGGDPARERPPRLPATSGLPGTSAFFFYMNTNARSVVLDLSDEADARRLRELAEQTDLLIEDGAPGALAALGLGYDVLSEASPGLVQTSITDFGQTGPQAGLRGSSLVLAALGGALYTTGDEADPPVALAGEQSYVVAGACAAAGSLIALRHRERTGQGQLVDVSVLEAVTSTTSICGVGKWREDGVVPKRFHTGIFASVPSGAYACRDGLAYLAVNRPLHWQTLARWIHDVTGNEEVLDPMFEGPSSARLPYRELLDVFIADLTARYTVRDFYHEGQARHLAITPVATARDLLADPHLEARGFVESLGGRRLPGAFAHLESTPSRLRTAAPRCGADADTPWAGPRASRAAPPHAGSSDRGAAGPESSARGALAGLRIVELTMGMAGPWIGRFMAACGADVIKLESIRHPDVTRLYVPPRGDRTGFQPQLSPWYTDWNAGKRFVSLDLTHPDGAALTRQLIGTADVLIENYSTGTLAKLGLATEDLRAAHPELVTFSTTGYGATGPHAEYITWGPNIEALSGLSTLSGFPERACTVTQYAYPDPLSALHGLFAVLCALDHRARGGGGQRIELAQVEATAAALGPLLVECLATGADPPRIGNRSRTGAVQNVYPCLGDDRWCAITLEADDDWARFCAATAREDLAGDPRFADAALRNTNADALDAEIAGWTRTRDAYAVMATLQNAGLAAGVVQTVEDQWERDPQLRARGFFETIPHDVRGEVIAPGIPLGLTETPARTPNAGAALGRDNRAILVEELGLSPERYDALEADGVVTDQEAFLALLGS